MAFYNPFPATYQNPYYQQVPMQQQMPVQTAPQLQQSQPQVQQAQPMNSNLIWVSGEAGAKAYLVAPNTTVQLWDSEAQKIYLKSADASGMPSIKTLDYTIRTENQPIQTVSVDENKFILREEFDSVKRELSVLQSELNKLKPKNNNRKEDKRYE